MGLRCDAMRFETRSCNVKVQVASKGQRRRPVSQAGSDKVELSRRSAIVRRESRREEGRGREIPKGRDLRKARIGFLHTTVSFPNPVMGAGSEVSTFHSGKKPVEPGFEFDHDPPVPPALRRYLPLPLQRLWRAVQRLATGRVALPRDAGSEAKASPLLAPTL